MQVCVERVALAQRGDYGQPRRLHAGAHEEDEVLVPRLPEGGHVQPERLECRLVVHVLHVQELDGHVAVPVAGVDSAEPTNANLVPNLHTKC